MSICRWGDCCGQLESISRQDYERERRLERREDRVVGGLAPGLRHWRGGPAVFDPSLPAVALSLSLLQAKLI